jgi:hypothetical protein
MPVAFRMATGLARSSACHLRQPRTAQERCVPARMDDGLQPPRIIKFFQANEVLRRDRGIPDCAVRPIARSTPVRRQGQPQKHSDIENPRITAALPWRALQKAHSRGAQMHGPAHQVKVKPVHWMMWRARDNVKALYKSAEPLKAASAQDHSSSVLSFHPQTSQDNGGARGRFPSESRRNWQTCRVRPAPWDSRF